jgi:hypothetical protein
MKSAASRANAKNFMISVCENGGFKLAGLIHVPIRDPVLAPHRRGALFAIYGPVHRQSASGERSVNIEEASYCKYSKVGMPDSWEGRPAMPGGEE